MDNIEFKGVFPILVTPFAANEALDLDSLERVVRFMVDAEMDGVTVLGVLGEVNRLTDAERDQVIATAVAAAEGRIPVIVGTSHPGTKACLDLSRRAAELGAGGVMIAPSREPNPSEQRVFEFYEHVAHGVDLPIVVQDHPASTQTFMSVSLLLRLVDEIPQVRCIKEEHPPTPQKLAALIEGMKERRVTLLQGLGALYGLFDLERGADGFMTGFAFPEVLHAMVQASRQGNVEHARALYGRFLPLIVFEQQPGLAIRKEIYRLRKLITANRVRHPGASIDEATSEQLRKLMDQVLPDVDLSRPINPNTV
jgi:4-hydroxy-tetrahydrodipicolinate synthase